MGSRSKKFSPLALLVREFAGSPLRVGVNIVLTTGAGVLIHYFLFNSAISETTVLGALMAPLIAILIAGGLKADDSHR